MKKALIRSAVTMFVIVPIALAFILTSSYDNRSVVVSSKSKFKASLLLPTDDKKEIKEIKVINIEKRNIELPEAKLKPTPEPEPEEIIEEQPIVQAIPDEKGVATCLVMVLIVLDVVIMVELHRELLICIKLYIITIVNMDRLGF